VTKVDRSIHPREQTLIEFGRNLKTRVMSTRVVVAIVKRSLGGGGGGLFNSLEISLTFE